MNRAENKGNQFRRMENAGNQGGDLENRSRNAGNQVKNGNWFNNKSV